MTEKELELLNRELSKCSDYLEFGSGNSTQLAVSYPDIHKITVVESSASFWNERVACIDEVKKAIEKGMVKPLLVDIGTTTMWGYPTDKSKKKNWPSYAKQAFEESSDYDLVLIDGRFRVACVLNACLQLKPNAKILIHDFYNRPEYHLVLRFLDEIEKVDTLGLFSVKEQNEKEQIAKLLKKYQWLPGDKTFFMRFKSRICGNK